ncbi:cyclic nucleotide-binding domain-containing protein [Pirellulales bacterium]|nr:cyclic nucleotide-binding domain-containing protein [Pirellulales bacterium]
MTEQEVIDALSNSSFFSDLPKEQLQPLVAIAREESFRSNTEIFRELEPAKDVFLVVSGRVALVICVAHLGCRQIMEVKDGDLIGWSPLLDRNRLSDTARTLTPVTTLAFDGSKLLKLCEENPSFGYEFMRRTAYVLSDRLNGVRRQLVNVNGANLPEVVLESD